jgi:hypothetical protein
MKHSLDKKFLEMLIMLIHQQNKQLAKIISEEESLPLHLVELYVPSTHNIRQLLQTRL